jgi:hypothetical protein
MASPCCRYATVTWYTGWWWITGWPFIGPERAQLVLCWLVETSIWLDEIHYSKL